MIITSIQEAKALCYEYLSCQNRQEQHYKPWWLLHIVPQRSFSPWLPTDTPPVNWRALQLPKMLSDMLQAITMSFKEFKNAFFETDAWMEQGAPRLSQILNTWIPLLFSNK